MAEFAGFCFGAVEWVIVVMEGGIGGVSSPGVGGMNSSRPERRMSDLAMGDVVEGSGSRRKLPQELGPVFGILLAD